MGDASRRVTPIGTRYVERFLRRVFNTVGPGTADHVLGDVQVDIEARPKDFWDYADFGIIPIAAHDTAAAGGAGTFSFVQYQPGITGLGAYHLLITRLGADAQFALVRLAAATQGGVASSVFPRDGIWQPGGTFGAGTTLADVRVGSTAAPGGQNVAEFLAANSHRDVGYLLRFGAPNFLFVVNPAANTPLTVDMEGLLIPQSVANL